VAAEASGTVEILFDPELTSPAELVEEVESCPSFAVKGSPTHELRDRPEGYGERPCCSGSSCPILWRADTVRFSLANHS